MPEKEKLGSVIGMILAGIVGAALYARYSGLVDKWNAKRVNVPDISETKRLESSWGGE